MMRITLVVKKGLRKEINEQEDLLYWLSKPPRERIEAVVGKLALPPGDPMLWAVLMKRKKRG
jgi:hypothetical protein